MGNDDVASVNARREYMGNVTVLVNQKLYLEGARYSRKRVVLFPSVTMPVFPFTRTCVQYMNLA